MVERYSLKVCVAGPTPARASMKIATGYSYFYQLEREALVEYTRNLNYGDKVLVDGQENVFLGYYNGYSKFYATHHEDFLLFPEYTHSIQWKVHDDAICYLRIFDTYMIRPSLSDWRKANVQKDTHIWKKVKGPRSSPQ